jgi:putative SOS response-associated peptidase YedK
VLTTTPLGIFSGMHDRKPSLLPQDRWDAWLDSESGPDLVWSLATAPNALYMAVHVYPVSLAVGNVRNEGAELTCALVGQLDMTVQSAGRIRT